MFIQAKITVKATRIQIAKEFEAFRVEQVNKTPDVLLFFDISDSTLVQTWDNYLNKLAEKNPITLYRQMYRPAPAGGTQRIGVPIWEIHLAEPKEGELELTIVGDLEYLHMSLVERLREHFGNRLTAQSRQTPERPQAPVKRATNPGSKAHAAAIARLKQGQSKEANFFEWKKEYEEEKGDLASKKSAPEELYRKRVWNEWKKPDGKI